MIFFYFYNYISLVCYSIFLNFDLLSLTSIIFFILVFMFYYAKVNRSYTCSIYHNPKIIYLSTKLLLYSSFSNKKNYDHKNEGQKIIWQINHCQIWSNFTFNRCFAFAIKLKRPRIIISNIIIIVQLFPL